MTVIVEDGTIVANANSYLSVSEADVYFTIERPSVSDWEPLDDDQKEASLRFATKLLDNECWLGYRAQPSVQSLAWPRTNVYDSDRQRYFASNEIPTFLKCAIAELAIALAREDRSLVAETAGGAGLKRAKIDVLEIEWLDKAAALAEDAKPLIPEIVMLFVRSYLCGNRGGMEVRLKRT